MLHRQPTDHDPEAPGHDPAADAQDPANIRPAIIPHPAAGAGAIAPISPDEARIVAIEELTQPQHYLTDNEISQRLKLIKTPIEGRGAGNQSTYLGLLVSSSYDSGKITELCSAMEVFPELNTFRTQLTKRLDKIPIVELCCKPMTLLEINRHLQRIEGWLSDDSTPALKRQGQEYKEYLINEALPSRIDQILLLAAENSHFINYAYAFCDYRDIANRSRLNLITDDSHRNLLQIAVSNLNYNVVMITLNAGMDANIQLDGKNVLHLFIESLRNLPAEDNLEETDLLILARVFSEFKDKRAALSPEAMRLLSECHVNIQNAAYAHYPEARIAPNPAVALPAAAPALVLAPLAPVVAPARNCSNCFGLC